MCKRNPFQISSPGTCGLLLLSPKTVCPFVGWLLSSALRLECASGKADGGYRGAETGTSAVARPGYPSSGDPAIAAGPAAKPHVDSSDGPRTRLPHGAASTTSGPTFGTTSPAPAHARGVVYARGRHPPPPRKVYCRGVAGIRHRSRGTYPAPRHALEWQVDDRA